MTLDSIEYKLGEISGQLEQLLKRLPSMERRITSLESFKWRFIGAFSVITLALTSAIEWFIHGRK